jgi:protein-disulfide isomerase
VSEQEESWVKKIKSEKSYNISYNIPQLHSQFKGPKESPITIVGFIDFQCPFSQRFQPAINEILKAYPNDVKFVLKNYPLHFHTQAKVASKAAFAAGEQGKYWEMAELLLKNGANLNEDKFKELAQELGLDVEKFMKDYREKDAIWEELINKDLSLASQVDVYGTPTYYINGRKTIARNFADFKAEIDQILFK